MFHLLNTIKNFIWHPGIRYTLPECIVVGLPMSHKNDYELHLQYPAYPELAGVRVHSIPSYLPDEIREPDAPPGFSFEHRDNNTIFVTFDPDALVIWTSGRKHLDFYFTLYDKTNDISVLRKYKFITRPGKPLKTILAPTTI